MAHSTSLYTVLLRVYINVFTVKLFALTTYLLVFIIQHKHKHNFTSGKLYIY